MNDISKSIIDEAVAISMDVGGNLSTYMVAVEGPVAKLIDTYTGNTVETFPIEKIEERLSAYGLSPEIGFLEIAQNRGRGVVPTRTLRPTGQQGVRPASIPTNPARVPEGVITTQTLPGETPFELIFRRIVSEIARKRNKNVTFESNKHSYSADELRNTNKLDFFKGEAGLNQSTAVKDAYLLRFDFVVRVNTLLVSLVNTTTTTDFTIGQVNPYNILFDGYQQADQISAIASLLGAISFGKISIFRVANKVFEDSLSKVKYSLGDIVQVGRITRNISNNNNNTELIALVVSPGIIFNYTALTPFLVGPFSFSDAFVINPGSELTAEVELGSQAVPYFAYNSALFSRVVGTGINGVPPVTIEMHFHTLRIY